MTNGNETNNRLDELERNFKMLLTAQVLHADSIAKLIRSQETTNTQMDRVENQLQTTNDRVDKLVSAIGHLIRKMDARES